MDSKTWQIMLTFISAIMSPPEDPHQPLLSPTMLQSIPVLLPQVQSSLESAREYLRDTFGSIESEACSNDLEMFVRGLIEKRSWALQMADASSRGPQSLTAGVTVYPGDFDSCLAVGPVHGAFGSFRGRHCLVSVCYATHGKPCASRLEDAIGALFEAAKTWKREGAQVNVTQLLELSGSYPLRMGVCAPSSCSVPELHALAQRLAEPFTAKYGIRTEVLEHNCAVADDVVDEGGGGDSGVDGSYVLATTVVVFFGSICIIAAFYDSATEGQHDRWETLLCFSLLRNARAVFNTSHMGRDTLPPIHGLRLFAIWLITGGHRFLWTFSTGLVLNSHYMEEMWKSYISLMLKAVMFAVDIFLILSGVLITYVFCNLKSEGKPTIWSVFYLHRIIRLSPLLLITVLIQSTVLPHLGDGPIWNQHVVCEVPWWPLTFFFSNYYELHRCINYTWYVAVDTQLYFLTPPLLALLWWRPRIAIRLMALLAAMGVVLRFWVASHYEMRVNTGVTGGGSSRHGKLMLFQSPYCRCPTFLMGMILGYKLYEVKHGYSKTASSRRRGALMWICVVVIMLITFRITHDFSQLDREYHPLWDPLVLALVNNFFGIGLCLFLYLSCTGRGGWIGQFFSWGGWQPLSRLTYAVYIVHVSVILWSTGTTRAPVTITALSTSLDAHRDFMLALAIALPLSLLFESPIVQLERLLLERNLRSRMKKDEKALLAVNYSQDSFKKTDKPTLIFA